MRLSMDSDRDCKAVESLLQPYLDNKLDTPSTQILLDHIKECRDCRDELEIRYLLSEGLKRIEDGESLDLNQELEDRMKRSRKRIRRRERVKSSLYLFEGGIVFAIIAYIIFFILGR